ncbi:MAG: hypothetical protein AB7O62_11995 [Pirellulales bacterium]
MACVGMVTLLLAGCGRSYNSDPLPNMDVVKEIRDAGATAESDGDSEAVASGGTGWGTLKGSFVLVGSAPQPKILSTGGKDAAACDIHPLSDPTLKVDSASGAVQDVLVFVRKVNRVHDSFESMIEQPVLFDQKECLFLQQMAVVFSGQVLTIKNSDPVPHNTAIKPPGDKEINPLLPPGDTFNTTFKRGQNKPVPVTCSIHPWMKAYVFPRKDPYAAVSQADGTFEIANLPAGEELEFQLWHAAGAGSDNGIKTSKTGPDGRFKLTIPADGVEDLQKIEIEPSAFNL